MKCLLFAAAMLIGTASFACGGSDEFEGAEAATKASRSTLNCMSDGQVSSANINVYAIYRCINSPVYGEIEAFGQKQKLQSVKQLSETTFEVKTRLGEMICEAKKVEVSKDLIVKARGLATSLYETIVGQSGTRSLQLIEAVESQQGSKNISTIKFSAKMERFKSPEKTPYEIVVKLADGNVSNISLKDLSE